MSEATHHGHIFQPLKVGPGCWDTFDSGNHQHKDKDDAENADDGHEAGVWCQATVPRPECESLGGHKQKVNLVRKICGRFKTA